MKNPEKRFTAVIECKHCQNRAPMEIKSEYSGIETEFDEGSPCTWEAGEVYQLLLCPACDAIMLRNYFWHDGYMSGPQDVEFKILYPSLRKTPDGLPTKIEKAYDVAIRIRHLDANAYAVLIGRVLELVCEDKNAQGKYLNDKLSDLSSKGEMPDKLGKMAKSLRILRNIGAHASLGELTSSEIPILDNLCTAILEYVYSAPFLVEQAEKKVAALKKAKKKKAKKKK